MTAIVFETPGLIDIRAFTTMGMSAKPNSDAPIGRFGTGLKYAIAVLVRMGAEPIVWIGRDQYVFYQDAIEFRGKQFSLVKMRAKKFPQRLFRHHDLPFTTEYGKFWQPWMVYRELEANTRDEGGTSYELPSQRAWGGEKTRIIVDHPEFYEVWQKRDEVFLPRASTSVDARQIMEVFPGENEYLYFRGMRVLKLPRPAMYTYNIVRNIELTEDRTVAWNHQIREALGDYVKISGDRELVRRVVTASEDYWERDVDFGSYFRPTPSQTFREVVRSKPSGLLSSAARAFVEEEEPEDTPEISEAHPAPWRVISDWIEDANERNIFQKPANYRGDWSVVAQEIVEVMNGRQTDKSSEGLSGVRDTQGTDALRLGAGIQTEDAPIPDAAIPF